MIDLRDAWRDILARRCALAPSLAPYGELLERWAAYAPPAQGFSWSAERCRETWGRGVPLAAEARPPLDAAHLEDLLGDAMEAVAALDPARAPALQRLQAEGEDAGYVIAGCRACHAYVKELDRRERWNGGPPLLEDWGSPHLDVVARREGLVKPLPALLDLAAR